MAALRCDERGDPVSVRPSVQSFDDAPRWPTVRSVGMELREHAEMNPLLWVAVAGIVVASNGEGYKADGKDLMVTFI